MSAELTRLRDWRARLSSLIETRRRQPFLQGQDGHNCALFAADCVAAMTGVDLAAAYRGRFTTIEQGLALLGQDGFADLGAFLAARLETIHPSRARHGDLMLLDGEGGEAIGIVNGERVTVLMRQGLGTVPLDRGKQAFRVP